MRALVLALFAVAAGLTLAGIATVFAKAWWVFDLATHFRVHYVAVAALATILALIVRRRAMAATIVLVALPHLLTISSLVPFNLSAAAAVGPETPLRVSTINVHWNNPTVDKVVDHVRRTQPDILVIQEADRRWRGELLELGALFPHAAPENWRDSRHVILFSRFPILHTERRYPENRGFAYQLADLDVDGQGITVIGIHPPQPTSADLWRMRNLYFANVARIVQENGPPTIVAGDFNSTVWSPHYSAFVKSAGLTNVADGRGWLPTWPSWFPAAGIAIDHILVSDRFAVRGVTCGPDVGSDHFPLTADIALR